jgi:hypothetical protein
VFVCGRVCAAFVCVGACVCVHHTDRRVHRSLCQAAALGHIRVPCAPKYSIRLRCGKERRQREEGMEGEEGMKRVCLGMRHVSICKFVLVKQGN